MAQIEWAKVSGQSEFDRVVEAFFVNENRDLGEGMYVVNGRGGDGGIDIHIRRDGRLIIVQLKFFPEGFSGGWKKTRQDQIRESFDTAMQHVPDEWWLVVPTTLTTDERAFVAGLGSRVPEGQKPPAIVIFDRPALDGLAARHPGLVTYFHRDELRAAAKDYNQETALLVNQQDLGARTRALADRASTLDPDWRFDIFTDGDVTGTILVPKHPQAAERSPITINITTQFGTDHAELREQFERTILYGIPEKIDLPAEVLENFTVDGPEFLHQPGETVSVSFIPVPPDMSAHKVSLVCYDETDTLTASFPGDVEWMGMAGSGVAVRARFFNALTLKALLPHDQSEGCQLSPQLSLAGCEPANVVRAITLLECFTEAKSVGLQLDGNEFARLLTHDDPNGMFPGDRMDILSHKEIAQDLVVVQDKTLGYFGYPETIRGADRIHVRVLRLLLEGRCVVLPFVHEASSTLSGEVDAGLKVLLGGDPKSLCIRRSDYVIEIFGHEIALGEVLLYAPQVVAVDGPELLNELEGGTGRGRTLTMRAVDDFGFWAHLPRLFVPEHDGTIRPSPLRLPGFPEAADVARANEATS